MKGLRGHRNVYILYNLCPVKVGPAAGPARLGLATCKRHVLDCDEGAREACIFDAPTAGLASFRQLSCRDCLEGAGLDFDFTMAFQPFVEAGTGAVFGYETPRAG